MGTYVFKWDKPASEVFVTGSFDNWSKSVELGKENGIFSKKVNLPSAHAKVFFKFVVDGKWVVDEHFATETDHSGNTNNVLEISDITSMSTAQGSHSMPTAAAAAAAAATSAVTSSSDEHATSSSDMPGTFPETPLGKPSPAIDLFPGDMVPDYSQYRSADTSNTASTDEGLLAKTHQEQEQTFGISPLPAQAGTHNPIKVAPGEKLPDPSSYTENTVASSHVKLDRESYEKSDAYPSATSGVVGGAAAAVSGAGASGEPKDALSSPTVPESSLAVGSGTNALVGNEPGPTIASSAGPNTSTAKLASQVPLEPRRVPEVVSESQDTAMASPEASSSPSALADKEKMEQELKAKVPEEPPAAEDSLAEKASVTGAAAGGSVFAAGAALAASAQNSMPVSVQNAIHDLKQGSNPLARDPAADTVPTEVSDSISKAHMPAEAAGNPEAVSDKAVMEKELQSKIHPSSGSSDSAPLTSATLGAGDFASGDPTIADDNTMAAISVANQTPSSVPAFESDPTKAGESGAGAAAATAATAATATAASGAPASASEATGVVATSAAPEASAVPSAIPTSVGGPIPAVHDTTVADRTKTAPTLSSSGNTMWTSDSSGVKAPVAAVSETPVTKASTTTTSTAAPATTTTSTVPATSSTTDTSATSATTSGLNAPADKPAQSVATETGQLAAQSEKPPKAALTAGTSSRARDDSRDVSPMTRGSGPTVTTGVATAETPSKQTGSSAPSQSAETASSTTSSPAAGSASKEDKKKNRRSFFGKIKDKLKQ